MVSVVVVVGLLMFLVLRALLMPGGGSARDRLLRRGLDAHGIVLSAGRYATSTTTVNGQRYETRQLRLDVEVPGRPPYELSMAPLIPRICEVYPGSRLDLRVDPRNPNNVAVVGPSGSIGWMSAMPALFPVQLAAASNVATRIVLLVFLGCVEAWALYSLLAPSSHEEPHAASTHAKTLAESPAESESCEAAARCCANARLGGCSSYGAMSEEACAAVLPGLRKAAAKRKRPCQ